MRKDLATTYSRGTYRTTTIGKAAFDGRVRDGIGSGHSFMVTKKSYNESAEFGVSFRLTGLMDLTLKLIKNEPGGRFPENYIQEATGMELNPTRFVF